MKTSLIRLGGLFTSLVPLSVYVGMNWEQFKPTVTESVKLGIGGAVVLFLGFLLALKKMRLPKGLFAVVLILGLLYAFELVIADIINIWTWFTVGYATDELFIEPMAKRVEKNAERKEQASVTAEAIMLASNKAKGRY